MSFASIAKESAKLAALFTVAEIAAQAYPARQKMLEAIARRRLARESGMEADSSPAEPRQRPSFKTMFSTIDRRWLGEAALFGALLGPLRMRWKLVNHRLYGDVTHHARHTLLAFSSQQFLATPVMLFLYFTTLTALRGGFSDPNGLLRSYARSDVLESRVFSYADLMAYISFGVLPVPLMWSWVALGPAAALSYFKISPTARAAGVTLCALPWMTYVAVTQHNYLL